MLAVISHPRRCSLNTWAPSAEQILLGAVINAAGNLIYAFTVLANGWWMMVIARCGCRALCPGFTRHKTPPSIPTRTFSLLPNSHPAPAPGTQAGGRCGRSHTRHRLELHYTDHHP